MKLCTFSTASYPCILNVTWYVLQLEEERHLGENRYCLCKSIQLFKPSLPYFSLFVGKITKYPCQTILGPDYANQAAREKRGEFHEIKTQLILLCTFFAPTLFSKVLPHYGLCRVECMNLSTWYALFIIV
jgi:hypothetical protein